MKRKHPSRNRSNRQHQRAHNPTARLLLVVVVLMVAATGLVVRAVELQVVDKDFYQKQGNNRFLRTMSIAVSRGTIFDRNGVPLAVSTPMTTLWMDPKIALEHPERFAELEQALDMPQGSLLQKIQDRADRRFVYLRRRMQPELAQEIVDLEIPGLYGEREYQRYYPLGKSMAHVVGFTGIDGQGQEGLELTYDDWLTGKEGAKLVMRDGYGRVVENVEQLHAPQPAHDLTLSIDSRIQYVAFRELQNVQERLKATSAAMIVMRPQNGEILAMASVPTFNPNDVSASSADDRRNRAAIDVFEPGSTSKAFTVAAALESGKWDASTKVDTGRGFYQLGKYTIRDDHPEGVLDVTGIITRSSNVGAVKLALGMDKESLYDMLRRVGFGQSTHSGYPGESPGLLPISRDWRKARQATIGYGYGFNVTLLQLAQAYGAIAGNGVLHQPTFVKDYKSESKQVMSPELARQMQQILRTVVENDRGTAYRTARMDNYSAGGKTGTSHQAVAGGYASDIYNSLFTGMAPADKPELVGAVVVRGAKGQYFGTLVAAPVFKKVMQESMRILNIAPDKLDTERLVPGTLTVTSAAPDEEDGNG